MRTLPAGSATDQALLARPPSADAIARLVPAGRAVATRAGHGGHGRGLDGKASVERILDQPVTIEVSGEEREVGLSDHYGLLMTVGS